MNNPDLSWKIFTRMEATGWKHLPFTGGLLDQPEWLMQDLFVLAAEKMHIEDALKKNESTESTRKSK